MKTQNKFAMINQTFSDSISHAAKLCAVEL